MGRRRTRGSASGYLPDELERSQLPRSNEGQTMRELLIRFTVQRWMVAVAVLALVLALVREASALVSSSSLCFSAFLY